ncbi:MAG: peptide chain release factor-like protein [Candidatus Aureabacteria bacterium]|nr:peptide chain release factor-like protein [Candidatus Auribacterota bacterium]
MSLFSVSSQKARELAERLRRLGVADRDLDESFVRSSGHGGQHINKSSTCVFLRHRPSGIAVKCQTSRSRALNRFLARRRLADKLEALRLGKLSREQQLREKIRRQKRRRSRKARARMLDEKRRRGEVKQLRSPVRGAPE